jgi:GNAT superfamily N-acetyltransferase
MSEITYRLASVNDAESLASLRVDFLIAVGDVPEQVSSLQPALHTYFKTKLASGEFVAFLAEQNSQIIATSGMVFSEHPPSPRYPEGRGAYIMNMYTLPAFRGRGIATALLQKLITLARDRRCTRISLHGLPIAEAIYTKAGFVECKSEMKLDLQSPV